MNPARASLLFVVSAIAAGALPVSAQARFGAAVAVAGGDVAVVKPGLGLGNASLTVFRLVGGAWERIADMGAIEPGPDEALGASVAAADDVILVAATDPAMRWAAHVYHRRQGGWQPAGRIPLTATSAPADRPAINDLDGLMRYAAPPLRRVAIASDGSTAAISAANGVVVIARPAANGTWESAQRIEAPTPWASARAPAIALSSTMLAVELATGGIQLYLRGPDGGWQAARRIDRPAALPDSAAWGVDVAVDGPDLLVDAPVSGQTFVYRAALTLDGPAERIDTGRRQPAGTSARLRSGELWVGDAAAGTGAGALRRFVRSADGLWQLAQVRDAAGPAEWHGGLGAAVALGTGLAVAGAPGANGGIGAVRVWQRAADGSFQQPATLDYIDALEPVASRVDCAAGKAGRFDCGNVDLLAFLPSASFGATPGELVSDLWGWTDPETHREYALVGRSLGVAIVDVTDASPRYLGVVPGRPAGPRDIKVFRNHMFFVGDGAGEHGLLIFDLTRLRNLPSTLPATFEPDVRYDGIASAHNLVLDEGTGTAIPVGSSAGGNTCGGGLHLIDVNDPKKPVFGGCYTDTEGLIYKGRTHDAQCTPYRGPDESWRGRDVCFVANETALRIVDITDRSKPVPISVATYPDRGYVHQGWLTEDQRYFFMNDEADELVGLTARTRTLIWDVADLDDPILAGQYYGPDAATDHNLYIRGTRMYLANYHAGLRVVDIADPLHPVEIGFFDTTPYNGNPSGWFGGAWSAYPFLESGTVLVSSMHEGLFLLRPRNRPVS